jgi:hypothetical protein
LATSWLLFHLDWLFSFVIVCTSCNVPITCCSCYSYNSCTLSFSIPPLLQFLSTLQFLLFKVFAFYVF